MASDDSALLPQQRTSMSEDFNNDRAYSEMVPPTQKQEKCSRCHGDSHGLICPECGKRSPDCRGSGVNTNEDLRASFPVVWPPTGTAAALGLPPDKPGEKTLKILNHGMGLLIFPNTDTEEMEIKDLLQKFMQQRGIRDSGRSDVPEPLGGLSLNEGENPSVAPFLKPLWLILDDGICVFQASNPFPIEGKVEIKADWWANREEAGLEAIAREAVRRYKLTGVEP